MSRMTLITILTAVSCLITAADIKNLSFDPPHRHVNNDASLKISFDISAPSTIEEAYLEVLIGGTGVTIPGSTITSGFSYTGNTLSLTGNDLYILAGGETTPFSLFPRVDPDDDGTTADEEMPDEDTFLPTDETISFDDDLPFKDADTEIPDTEMVWPSNRDGRYSVTLVLVVDRDSIPDADLDADTDYDTTTDTDYVVFSPRATIVGSETRETFTVTLDNVPPAAPDSITVEGGNRKLVVTVTPPAKDAKGKSGEKIGAYHLTVSGIFAKGDSEESTTLTYVKKLPENERDDTRHTFTIEGKDGYALINNDSGNATYSYRLRIWAEDLAGNSNETQAIETTASATTTEGFWSHYKRAGGGEKGDYCFIATAGYGDHNHPFVQVLRTWRDTYLAPYDWGQRFIGWYYHIGPLLGNLVKILPAGRPLTQMILFPLVLLAWLMLNPWVIVFSMVFSLLVFGNRTRVFLFLLVVSTGTFLLDAAEKETLTEKDEKENKERSVKEDEKIELHGNFLFAFGFYDPKNLDKNVPGTPIGDILTSNVNLLPAFHFGIDIPAGKHLKVTPHVGAGFVELHGRSLKLDGTPGAERSYFYILPIMGEITVRPVYTFPIRPYIAAGLDYYVWWILEDRKLAEDGGKFGFHGTGGIQISLNFIDPKTAVRFREATGITDTALFVHYRAEQVDNFFAKEGFNLSSSRFEFGIMFDY